MYTVKVKTWWIDLEVFVGLTLSTVLFFYIFGGLNELLVTKFGPLILIAFSLQIFLMGVCARYFLLAELSVKFVPQGVITPSVFIQSRLVPWNDLILVHNFWPNPIIVVKKSYFSFSPNRVILPKLAIIQDRANFLAYLDQVLPKSHPLRRYYLKS